MSERTSAPLISTSAGIKIREPEKIILSNQIPLYIFSMAEQDVMKIEILFRAGAAEDKNFLIADAVSALLDEGTVSHSAAQIADEFEFYGAHIENNCTADWASMSLFSMNKFLDNVLPLFIEIITEPVFPEKEIETYKTQNKQRLQVKNNKVDYLARKNFNQKLFGQNSAYGFYQSVNDYDRIERNSLISFHQSKYPQNVFAIIVSGKVESGSIKLLSKYFGSGLSFSKAENNLLQNFISIPGKHPVPKTGAVQSGLRIGKILFNKTHPDYAALSIVNTLLGGYFGSRLMSNIREEKGYTYGIGSLLVSLQQTGYFTIATEVGIEVKDSTLKEIYFEIDGLRNELVEQKELDLVKNYLTGSFQRSIDGPFALSERFKSVVTYGLDFNYFYQYLNLINTITPIDILGISGQYLDPGSITEIVVG